jgi:hypothetical protein
MPYRKVILIATRRGKKYLIVAALIALLIIFSCSILTILFIKANVHTDENYQKINAPGQFLPEGEKIPNDIINEILTFHTKAFAS